MFNYCISLAKCWCMDRLSSLIEALIGMRVISWRLVCLMVSIFTTFGNAVSQDFENTYHGECAISGDLIRFRTDFIYGEIPNDDWIAPNFTVHGSAGDNNLNVRALAIHGTYLEYTDGWYADPVLVTGTFAVGANQSVTIPASKPNGWRARFYSQPGSGKQLPNAVWRVELRRGYLVLDTAYIAIAVSGSVSTKYQNYANQRFITSINDLPEAVHLYQGGAQAIPLEGREGIDDRVEVRTDVSDCTQGSQEDVRLRVGGRDYPLGVIAGGQSGSGVTFAKTVTDTLQGASLRDTEVELYVGDHVVGRMRTGATFPNHQFIADFGSIDLCEDEDCERCRTGCIPGDFKAQLKRGRTWLGWP